MNYSNNNFNEVLKRVMKYFLEGLAVSFAAFWIPRRRMDVEDIIVIAITAATTFAVLDMWAPSTVAGAARWGAGFGIGASLGAGGAGPIFPAENFISELSTGETAPELAATGANPVATETGLDANVTATGTDPSTVATWEDIVSTAVEAPEIAPGISKLPPSNSELLGHTKTVPVETQEVIKDGKLEGKNPSSPSISTDNYQIPPIFKRNMHPNEIPESRFICRWNVNNAVIINGQPEGYIGKCYTPEGLISLDKS
jgi:hypothetical protein